MIDMNLNSKRSFIGILILLAYISIGVFGLFGFNHMSEQPMINCPYTESSFSICENTFDHINLWQQFFDIVLPSFVVFSFLMLGIVLYFFNKQSLLNFFLRSFSQWKYFLDDKILSFYKNKIIQYLSLFENSPSFLYVRHS